jgi:hypothetical protein
MGGHIRIGAVDLRLVEAALDDRGLGVVRNDEMRRPADRLESADMRADKIGERLRPDRFRVSEVRRPPSRPQRSGRSASLLSAGRQRWKRRLRRSPRKASRPPHGSAAS